MWQHHHIYSSVGHAGCGHQLHQQWRWGGHVNGGECSESPGCINDSQEHICSVIRNEGGGVGVYGAMSMVVKEEVEARQNMSSVSERGGEWAMAAAAGVTAPVLMAVNRIVVEPSRYRHCRSL